MSGLWLVAYLYRNRRATRTHPLCRPSCIKTIMHLNIVEKNHDCRNRVSMHQIWLKSTERWNMLTPKHYWYLSTEYYWFDVIIGGRVRALFLGSGSAISKFCGLGSGSAAKSSVRFGFGWNLGFGFGLRKSVRNVKNVENKTKTAKFSVKWEWKDAERSEVKNYCALFFSKFSQKWTKWA